MYEGSLDNKDLWANKQILISIMALTGKKRDSIVFGGVLTVLYLGVQVNPVILQEWDRPLKNITGEI